MLERIGFVLVKWKACRGLSGPSPFHARRAEA
jgi:hypothetical protein